MKITMTRATKSFSRLLRGPIFEDADDLEPIGSASTPFVANTTPGSAHHADAHDAYAISRPPAVVSEPVRKQQSVEEILGDLSGLTRAELARKRRDFARQYHPDQFQGQTSDDASERMSLANRLIDKAMRDLHL